MKKIYTLLLVSFFASSVQSQTTLFWETFGVDSVVAEPLRPHWTAGGPAATNLNIVINSQDTPTIVGGSGMGNLINSRRVGSVPATLPGISTYTLGGGAVSTVGYTTIKVTWACRKTASDSTDVSLEWSNDSVTWNTVNFLPDTAQHPARWVLANEGALISLAVGAEGAPNLRFRFTLNRTGSAANAGNYRIDDFKVIGTAIVAGIDNITSNKTELTVSPNPAHAATVIRHPAAGKNASIEIYSSNGLLVYQTKPSNTSKQTTVDLSKFSTGVYMVRIKDGSKTYTTRIVKN